MMSKMQIQKGVVLDRRVINGAGHFFSDHIEELMAHMHDHLNKSGGGRDVNVPLELIEAA